MGKERTISSAKGRKIPSSPKLVCKAKTLSDFFSSALVGKVIHRIVEVRPKMAPTPPSYKREHKKKKK